MDANQIKVIEKKDKKRKKGHRVQASVEYAQREKERRERESMEYTLDQEAKRKNMAIKF